MKSISSIFTMINKTIIILYFSIFYLFPHLKKSVFAVLNSVDYLKLN